MGRRTQADLVIIGGGAMGLATAWAAASPERRVVLLERHEPGHKRGTSHGTERIFRFSYDKPLYVRLATEADELWRRLESQSRRTLIDRIGAIEHGDPAELAAIAAACRGFDIDVRWYDPAEAKRRWPGYRFTTPVLHQPAAGCVRAADTLVAGVRTTFDSTTARWRERTERCSWRKLLSGDDGDPSAGRLPLPLSLGRIPAS